MKKMKTVFALYAVNHILQVSQGKVGCNALNASIGHMKNAQDRKIYMFAKIVIQNDNKISLG